MYRPACSPRTLRQIENKEEEEDLFKDDDMNRFIGGYNNKDKDKCLIILRGLKAPYGVEGEGKINKCPKTKGLYCIVLYLFKFFATRAIQQKLTYKPYLAKP